MKRTPFVVVAALLAAVLVSYVVWGERMLSFLGIGSDTSTYLGYVEGETSLIAPPIAGRLLERPVDETHFEPGGAHHLGRGGILGEIRQLPRRQTTNLVGSTPSM